ncbi:MAG: sodium:proton antiporter [Thermoguttaceae bacterium]
MSAHVEKHENGHGHGHEVSATSSAGLRLAVIALVLLLLGYVGLVAAKLPQKWTEEANSHSVDSHSADHGTEKSAEHGERAKEAEHGEAGETDAHSAQPGHTGSAEQGAEHHAKPPYWMIIPFAALLLCIAVLPLIPATEHWWESNRNRFLVAASLGLLTLAYYFFVCNFPVALHWPTHKIIDPAVQGSFAVVSAIFINAIVSEFIPFIILLFSLYTIAGGIRIEGDLKAKPATNAAILFLGAILASFVGTTGAAMLLIRLLLDTNKQRKYKVHTIVFFIFCVCNCGGCLLPIGDPPLFLGYLRGVPFLWTFGLWKEWAFMNCILIAVYFLWDTFYFYPHETKKDVAQDSREVQPLRISGLGLNLPLLLAVVLSIMFLDPTKTVPGTDWHPWYFLREAVQLLCVAISLGLGQYAVRKGNSFTFAAIIEVAALFFGIFICMQAPLQILNVEGKNIGLTNSHQFFWATGALSSVLDNAPTYVVFFETARTLSPDKEEDYNTPELKERFKSVIPINGGFIDHHLLAAISLGAVFLGAMTYIGNGPNFMVKAVAEQSGVKMPSFFGYMIYSCCLLLPLFYLMTMIFL